MVAVDSPGDGELIARSKKGDRKAFGLLVRRYQKQVYALCFRLGGSHDVADDLTQEAFIRAFQAIQSFDERYAFGQWITRIAANNAYNFLQRQKFEVKGEDGELILSQQSASGAEANPHCQLLEKEIDRRYQEAVAQLPPEFRIVFVMRMQEEMSYAEIARSLGITAGTVMSRLHRARQRLVEMLKDLLEP